MITTRLLTVGCIVGLVQAADVPFTSAEVLGSSLTYQGRLQDGSASATGSYDLRFALYDAGTSGTRVGALLTNTATLVTSGLFSVELDFGPVFDGKALWLDIGVRTNGGGAFLSLTPRQPLTAAPYASFAPVAGSAEAVAATSISGTIPLAQLPANLLTNHASGVQLSGTFSGGGAGLTNLNAWVLGGNVLAGGESIGSLNAQPLELKVNGQRALRVEPTVAGAPNLVAGAPLNTVDPGVVGAVIAGGGATSYLGSAYSNAVSVDFGVIGGGANNRIQAGAAHAVIAGGYVNTIANSAYDATISGGQRNTIETTADRATIGGGQLNLIQTNASSGTIGGGYGNWLQTGAKFGTIAGGYGNLLDRAATYSTIGGGVQNTVGYTGDYATIGGGYSNVIQDNADAATIAGGYTNVVTMNATAAAIGGGRSNWVSGVCAVVPGGAECQALGAYSLAAGCRSLAGGVGGIALGSNCVAGYSGGFAGGWSAYSAAVGATALGWGTYAGNFFGVADGATAIGYKTTALANGSTAIGQQTTANAEAATALGASTVASGKAAFAAGSGSMATNEAATALGSQTLAGGPNSTAMGWGSSATGLNATAMGEASSAGGRTATAMGFWNNASADFTAALGCHAQALHQGSFVWADAQDPLFASTAPNQFQIRATGGVGIASPRGISLNAYDGPMLTRGWDPFDSSAGPDKAGQGRWGMFMEPMVLQIGMPMEEGVGNRYVCIGKYWPDGTWQSIIEVRNYLNHVLMTGDLTVMGEIHDSSDRNLKENFESIDPRQVLERVASLPISSWNYKTKQNSRHVGPMAQDFKAAFGLGSDDKSICTVDADGVALAAIQGLNQKLEEQRAENAALKRELAELRKTVEQCVGALRNPPR